MSLTKSPTSSKKTTRNSSPNGGRASGISDELRLAGVDFAAGKIVARFANGSAIAVNLNRYPRLQQATPAQRNKWRLIGRGSGVHWENLDEDLSVENLLFASAKTAED